MTAAACAAVQCWQEYSPGTPEYEKAVAMADWGNRPELAVERKQIADEKKSGLFDYSDTDIVTDRFKRAKNTVVQAVDNARKLIWAIGKNGPYALPQTPPDLPDDFDQKPPSGSAGAVVTGPVLSCIPNLGCTMVPSLAVPLNVSASVGSNGNNTSQGDDPSNSGNASNSQGSPIDVSHAIGADYTKLGKPTGGHSLLNGDVRIVPGTESKPNAAGVYEATIQVPDPANPGGWITKTANNSKNTMFPKNWDATQIQAEVDAAWNSPKRTVMGDKWNSETPSGVKVEGFVRPRITVYPIY